MIISRILFPTATQREEPLTDQIPKLVPTYVAARLLHTTTHRVRDLAEQACLRSVNGWISTDDIAHLRGDIEITARELATAEGRYEHVKEQWRDATARHRATKQQIFNPVMSTGNDPDHQPRRRQGHQLEALFHRQAVQVRPCSERLVSSKACVECNREQSRQWYAANPAKLRELRASGAQPIPNMNNSATPMIRLQVHSKRAAACTSRSRQI